MALKLPALELPALPALRDLSLKQSANLIVGVLAIVIVVPFFIGDYWIFLASAGCLTAVTALGLAVIIGWAGEITLAGGALLGTSVYITGYLFREGDSALNNWPFIPAAIVGILAATLLSALVSIPTVKFSGVYVIVLTMGMQITLERTLFSFPWIQGGFGRNIILPRQEIFGFKFDSDLRYFYLCFAVMALAGIFVYLFGRSRHGRAIGLVRTDRHAAAAVGISAWKYKILAFAVGGGLIGVAGAFTAPLYKAPPAIIQFVLLQSLFLLAIPIVAGTNTVIGICVTALIFQLVPFALESHGLSVLTLGGIGLIVGTYIGPKGMYGSLVEMVQAQRDQAVLSAIASENSDESTVS